MAKKKTKTVKAESTDLDTGDKRHYASATERILNNLDAMLRSSRLVGERMELWIKYAPEDKTAPKIQAFREEIATIDASVEEVRERMMKLFESYTPPKPVKKTQIEVGDTVKIAKKYRDKYESAYKSANLDLLMVENIDERFVTVFDEENDVRFMVAGKAHLAHSRAVSEED
jgi:hypothetical protein